MPKRTAADKAVNSIAFNEKQIQEAYGTGEIDAPLVAAVSWLRASLKQRSREDPGNASEFYKHATDQIAAYAKLMQHRIIDRSKQKAT